MGVRRPCPGVIHKLKRAKLALIANLARFDNIRRLTEPDDDEGVPELFDAVELGGCFEVGVLIYGLLCICFNISDSHLSKT